MQRIAVLITCHNRKDKTLKCLEMLSSQVLPSQVELQVYLTDDGCTDGTGDAVREQFPDVNVIDGDGDLYWCGGMRLAWAEAAKSDYNYYLWANDDTHFYPDCIKKLLAVAEEKLAEKSKPCIVVGSVCDLKTGEWTYGGRQRRRIGKDISGDKVFSEKTPVKCDAINGNCVLVPKEIFETIGNLSSDYTHCMGDHDYGFRAMQAGFEIWVAPGFIGTCSKNPLAAWSSPKTPLFKRLRLLYSPKGLALKEYITFCKRHTGMNWIVYWLKAHLKTIFPQLWKLKK